MLHGFATSHLKDTLLAEPTAPPLREPAEDGRGRSVDEAGRSDVHPYPRLHRRLHDTQVAVGTFISGTLLYVLSRQWQDLLAVNVFHLHPLPFCDTAYGNSSQLPCTEEAGSGVQFLFAVGLLCVAAAVQACSLRNEERWPSLIVVPRMLGMCVGWAFGFAALQALSEMEAWPMFSHLSSWVLGAAVSACATLLSALIILAGQPSTLCVGWAAEHLEDLWPMCSHALSVMVMMLWTAALKAALVGGVPAAQQYGLLYQRMLFFYATTLTATCSFANVHLVRCRRAALETLRATEHERRHLAHHLPLHRLRRRVNRRATLVHVLSLLEQSFSWVVGSAWTNFVISITSLALFPTLEVVLSDAAVALLLTVLGLAWVILTASPASPRSQPRPEGGEVSRDLSARLEAELCLLTNATGFFVGFAWITLLRDVATLAARVGAASGQQSVSYLGELLCVTAFGPVLTYVLVRSMTGRHRHRRAVQRVPSAAAQLDRQALLYCPADRDLDSSSVAGHAWYQLLQRMGLRPSSLPASPHGWGAAHVSELELGGMHDYELEGDGGEEAVAPFGSPRTRWAEE